MRDKLIYERPKSYTELTDEQLLDLYRYSELISVNENLKTYMESEKPKPYLVYSKEARTILKREILRRMNTEGEGAKV